MRTMSAWDLTRSANEPASAIENETRKSKFETRAALRRIFRLLKRSRRANIAVQDLNGSLRQCIHLAPILLVQITGVQCSREVVAHFKSRTTGQATKRHVFLVGNSTEPLGNVSSYRKSDTADL